MEHRKYGTKPAYVDASIGGAWIFYDGDDWSHKMVRDTGRANQFENVAAVVKYSPYSEFSDLSIGYEVDDSGVVYSTGNVGDKVDFTLYIGKNGIISTDPDGLEEFGAALGLPHTQEIALKAEVVSNFYDLSMPLTRHRPEDKTFENLVDKRKQTFNPIEDLLIPRIRYMEQTENFPASDDITRTVREHDVTWFVRTLPGHCRASPEAVAEAAAHGIELEENETFVKAHKRGSQNRVLGYHAVKRSTK